MSKDRLCEIDENYDFFQRKLKGLLQRHKGQFALLRHKRIIGYYTGPGDAYRAGLAKFPDQIFSIQEVEDRPAEIGLVSVALD
ncbi:hypothetical protein [Alteraurantiacibacter palmitatis]|uniref:DUF5678 domain-containing protein n=1 Tax=Alteraurantiacibacter palmitatis TaxID=2054628 RepID=A0ABV7E1L9_9SPHN